MKPAMPPSFTFLPERHMHLLDERKEPYQDYSALDGEAQCVSCGAVNKDGRWQWLEPSIDATVARCPACRRLEEHAPAAYLEIEGPILADRREELVGTIREMEHLERATDPLQRIMAIDDTGKGLMVTATDVRLARAIAQRLQTAYRCELDFHYDRDRSLLWLRCRG